MVQLCAVEGLTAIMGDYLTESQKKQELLPLFMDFIDKDRKRDDASMENLCKLLGAFVHNLPDQETREEIEGDVLDFFKECCYSS